MPILKYKINGQWVELSSGASGSDVEIDTSLTVEGAAADAKATGNSIAKKQNKVLFNTTQPANWVNGDIWLKPAE